jgi:hypothetical protein
LSSLSPKQLFLQPQLFQNIKKAPADFYRTTPFDYYEQGSEDQVKCEKIEFSGNSDFLTPNLSANAIIISAIIIIESLESSLSCFWELISAHPE